MFSKYYELGLSVLPIAPNSKVPPIGVDKFQRWSEERQPPELIEEWEEKYPISRGYGIAIVLGKVSNLCVVDIDTLREDIIAECPTSPIVRLGNPARYGALFFQPAEGLCSRPNGVTFNRDDGTSEKHGVEVLFMGKYILVPPSINPVSKTPYLWLTPDTIENMGSSELPLLKPEHVERIDKKFELLKMGIGETGRVALGAAGRNDYLKSIVWAKRANGEVEEDIVEAVYQVDKAKHDSRLFTDSHERFTAVTEEDARMNAWKFVNRVTGSFIQRRAGPAPRMRAPEIVLEKKYAPAWKPVPLPEPSGLVREMRDLIMGASFRDQNSIAMAASVSIASALVANRFRMGNIWPNIYALVLADTGMGKDAAFNGAKRLLAMDNDTGLLGKAQCLSGQALVSDLASQPQRLDLIDEAAGLFAMITKGGVFQADIMKHLLSLYTDSSSMFMGPSVKGADPVRVMHPCISILMLTNPSDYKLYVMKNFITCGFIPRTLVFSEWTYGAFKRNPSWDEGLAAEVNRQIRAISAIPIQYESAEDKAKGGGNLLISKPIPREAPMSAAAKSMFDDYSAEIAKKQETEPASVRKDMETRLGVNAMKLALSHGVLSSGMVDIRDADWGISLAQTLLHNSLPVIESAAASTPMEAATLGILNLIRQKGQMTIAEIVEATFHLGKSLRNDALDALVTAKKVDKNGLLFRVQ